MVGRVLIGTSGRHYASWRGPFFPDGLPLERQLQYYASQFPSAELNGVFYRTPTPEAVRGWREQTGKDFVFAWKAREWAARIKGWRRQGVDVYVYFDNDQKSAAPLDALRLARMLEK